MTSQKTAEGVALVQRFEAFRREAVNFTIRCRQDLERRRLTKDEVVDLAWVMKELGELSEHVKKGARDINELLDKVACVAWVTMCTADPETPGRLEGEIAVGTPKVGTAANTPSRKTNPEAYAALMKHLGASDEIIAKGILRPHWPELCDELDRRAAEGLPPPPGIPAEMTYSRYHLVNLSLKKGVNIYQEQR